ncbi:MAG TPA: hypothetical protein VGZ02_12895 [Candidatus Baltobacteraceae bacterium]|jgi:hypothetical protein|nr:hypothetical protein [Candidatus Baltobacteraceae bacterium]
MRTLSRLIPLALAAAVLSACGSSGSSGSTPPVGGFSPGGAASSCNPAQMQLANPAPFSTGVSTNLSSVVIVANGNSNPLAQAYGVWEVQLADQNSGNLVTGGPLQPTDGHTLVHPYNQDFYYSSSLQGQFLTPGTVWEVLMFNTQQGCTLDLQQSFAT